MTRYVIPPKCDAEIFRYGEPIALLDARSAPAEAWVKAVAKAADAKIDWHYSGGVAQVLHLGDSDSRSRVELAMAELETSLVGSIIRMLPPGAEGLYRRGVTSMPGGTLCGFSHGGESSAFIQKPDQSA